ncbi:MAG: sensor histidine kinase [Clostridium sp.]|nr:sensor histidine kinase [Clostridium sp.]
MTNNNSVKKENSNINKSNKGIINLIAFTIMIIMAIGITCYYPRLKQISKMEYESQYGDYGLMERIDRCSMFLYKEILDKDNSSNSSVIDTFIKSYDEEKLKENNEEYNAKGDIEDTNFARQLETRYSNGKTDLKRNFKNLDYVVLDKDGNVIMSNTENDLKDAAGWSENEEKLNDYYGFYIAVSYDSTGKAQVVNSYGIEGSSVRDCFGDNIDTLVNDEYIRRYNIEFNNISDTTFIYGIPKDLKYNDEISKIVYERVSGSLDQGKIALHGFLAGCIIFVIALAVPYKKSKEIAGNKACFKVPFEINCLLYGFATIALIGSGIVAVMGTLSGDLSKAIVKLFNIQLVSAGFIVNIANVVLWTVIIYFIVNGVTLLKHIFKTGFKSYMRDNLLILRIWRFSLRKAEGFYDYLCHIDLTDKTNKDLIKVLGVNFIILSVMSMIWFVGIGAAFLYSIALFFIGRKYYDDVREKFRKLLTETNKIANGNLEGEISEDLGIFNPFKEELKKIQSGFKKAVGEEVKSQKMKTELISNVSHDLKTPLTSIITYVDLLKKDDITEEERKSYIDTLDKKSQRLKFLIEDLFEVSKANSGNVKVNLVNVDIAELIKQSEFELEDKFNASNLIIKNNFPQEKIIVSLDSQKTFRIFENLFNNVSKYAMVNSRVYVDMIDEEGEITVTIKNISASEMNFRSDEIVERFTRGDKSRNTEGSGLGLAIVKSFVELQNGKFEIDIDGDLFKVTIKFKK